MSALRESMGRMNVVDHSGDFSVPDKPSSRENKNRDVSSAYQWGISRI